jgi:transcriptional regulator with XRE-family HTH domain
MTMTDAPNVKKTEAPVKTALQVAREAAKLSVTELAAKAGVAEVLVQRGENGLRIFKDTARKLATALDLPVEKLFDYMVPIVPKAAPAKPAAADTTKPETPPDAETPMKSKTAAAAETLHGGIPAPTGTHATAEGAEATDEYTGVTNS